MDEHLRAQLSGFELPRIVRLRPNLYAACFQLMKLLPARFMLDRAEDRGELPPAGHIVETTSGTFGLALSMLAAVRGYKLSLVTASSLIDDSFATRLSNIGARLHITPDPEGSGDQKGRLARLAEIRANDPASYWPNQYDNPDNPLAYAVAAEHLLRSIGPVDCFVASVGSGGSLSGTGRFLRTVSAQTRIIAADTHGSVLFGQMLAPRTLRGMGNSIVPKNLRHDLVDEVHWIGGRLGIDAAFHLFRSHGLFVGPTSGASFLVADWYANLHPDEKVVFFLPDEGHRYGSLFSRRPEPSISSLSIDVQRPRMTDRIIGGSETDWLRFAWRRRALDDVIGFSRGTA